MINFYDAYVKSRVFYGVLIYGHSSGTYLSEILKAQKRKIWFIFFKRLLESVHDIMNKNSLANVDELYLFELFREVFHQMRRKSPVKLLNLSELNSRPNTRSSTKCILLSHSSRTNYGMTNYVAYNFVIENQLIPTKLEKITHKAFEFSFGNSGNYTSVTISLSIVFFLHIHASRHHLLP